MLHAATSYGLIVRRRRRAFFLARHTQQMESPAATFREVTRETVRALIAVSAAVAWGSLLLLLAG